MGKIRHSSHWGAFNAEVIDGRLVGVSPFKTDPNPSPILQAMPDALYHDCRVAEPMIRKTWLEKGPNGDRETRGGEAFVAVSWDKALDLVASELERVKREHGNAAIFGGSYGWASAGRFHHAKTQLQRFLNGHGGFTAQVHSYSIAAGLAILPHILGDLQSLRRVSSWRDITENTTLLVSFGGVGLKNTQVEPGGAGEHSTDIWLRRIRAANIDVVNVTPLRDDTPDYLDAQWLAPRPNSDVALMLGLAHTLVSEHLHDLAFLGRYCVGFERFERYLMGVADGQPKDAHWASDITGISEDTICALARRMASNRTMITTSYSLQRGDHGEQTFWMTAVLAAILGQVGLPGGGFGFGYGSMQGQGNPIEPITAPNLSAGANPTGSFIPVARIADMLLNPGARYEFNGRTRTYPDTRMIYWCGGNPFHHHQDINRLVEAFRQPETIVVHEPWWTATARHADIVLPATTTLERNDIGSSSRDRFIIAMEQAVDPVGMARNDHDIFADLAERLGFRDTFTEDRNESEWLRHLYDVARQQAAQKRLELPDFDTFWANGHVEIPEPSKPHTVFSDFRSDPNANPLKTPSGKIEIFSETIDGFGYDDCPGHPVWLEPVEWLGSAAAKRFPLHMMSNQPATRLHAQMDCASVSQDAKINGREPVALNPADASARNIGAGDIVRVFNDRGETLAGAELSEAVMPGVIRLATGAWYDPATPGQVGTLDKHGNPNVLTIDRGTSKLGQGPISHSTLVEVERYDGDLPEITAFTGPTARRNNPMSEKRVDTVRLQNLAMGFWQSASLMAAVELGLFTAISKGAGTAAEIATALDISERNADRLATVCRAMDLIDSDSDGRYRNADDVQRFLVEGETGYAGPWILFTKPRWNNMGQLSDFLRRSEEAVLGQYEGLTVEAARRMHEATYSVGMGAARRFIRQVELSDRKKILDLGGGSGAYSITAAKTHPHIEAVVFDLPPVAEVAREYIAEHGVEERVSALGGDFTADPFPTGCDVVIMASNLPLYSREIIAQVIKSACEALEPGGEMHLIGETLQDDRSGPIGPALWGLAEAINGSTGMAHSEADCIGYFEAAGFECVAVHEFIPGTLSRIVGTKPQK